MKKRDETDRNTGTNSYRSKYKKTKELSKPDKKKLAV
jgi:hypothetical protein